MYLKQPPKLAMAQSELNRSYTYHTYASKAGGDLGLIPTVLHQAKNCHSFREQEG